MMQLDKPSYSLEGTGKLIWRKNRTAGHYNLRQTVPNSLRQRTPRSFLRALLRRYARKKAGLRQRSWGKHTWIPPWPFLGKFYGTGNRP